MMLLEVAVRVSVTRQTAKLKTQLEAKLRRLFIQHRSAYLAKFVKLRAQFNEALSDDAIDAVFDDTAPSLQMSSAIETAVENGLLMGAENLLAQFGTFKPDVVFNLKNPRAVDYLKNYGVDRVTQMDDTSKSMLRDLITREIERGTGYDKIARLIRAQFTDWSTKRAKLVAITEIGNAYQQGNLIVGKDLADAGLQMQKSWLTRGDDKVDPHCQANQDDGWIDVNNSFSSGADVPLDHPRCRCVTLYRRKPSE